MLLLLLLLLMMMMMTSSTVSTLYTVFCALPGLRPQPIIFPIPQPGPFPATYCILYVTLFTAYSYIVISFLPAAIAKADIVTGRPCRYCFYSVVQKWVFRLAGATCCPDKREIWHGGGRSSLPNFTFIGAKMSEYSPKTVKISNFGQKFVPQGWLICNIFYEILSVCTRL